MAKKTYILKLYRVEDGGFVKGWSTSDYSLAKTVKLQWEKDYSPNYYVILEEIDLRMV